MPSKLVGGTARVARAGANLGRLTGLIAKLEEMMRTYRQRRALLALSDHMLRDIGLSRADAYREGTRAFWELPPR